ncbi:AP-3 complex subunit delta-1 [Sporothrix schenckii 1099-18]|uniref:AP-3 complex subunit delta n=1 Tax=Sporothrix schenckii 1099-18 TaxID=1397361 RepID=A0A0F2M8E3_SPOSC|nr:AP-3 complex subunit delta-1 [Sporothrix schenckii 1099-18]KJR84431.1 AP-3 complex subunit delta-1 [Sporothrix schenckii 1099-18]
MDVKATALLKLVYLEMVGHDMSWASFHVLEVMSSQKLQQKRIGYLAAVQSFRSDTEVLMLATNLLKKDLSATSPIAIQLPIATLPHIITPSLALSVLPDLLPRLTHSHRVIRKKTIVTLYRMALVYPETLRAAWPKIKERLMDPAEDPSVTTAIVNVICELGWRRPHDFLPLAPRLFELLVGTNNNWMAIKLIKLFATLTPLEPRLVRKLLPPLTDFIRTTPAMSLLYECINGIIQGGILGSDDDSSGREEIASLCVTKLRGMMMIENDTNCEYITHKWRTSSCTGTATNQTVKYVALLAFNKIVATHPYLVAQQEDVILECIDSPDISIRIKALDLVQDMVSSDNLVSIVGRLMRQLKQASSAEPVKQIEVRQMEFRAESDDELEGARPPAKNKNQETPLPEDYKIDVIHRILAMCSQNNYSNLTDFDWYIDILTQLLRTAPSPRAADGDSDNDGGALGTLSGSAAAANVSEKIGSELRNVAVKVHALRPAAVRAADEVIVQLSSEAASAAAVGAQVMSTALKPLAWMTGEYSLYLLSANDTLTGLLQLLPRIRFADVLATCLQAVVKLFAFVVSDGQAHNLDLGWTPERKSNIALLLARLVHAMEPLVQHPQLEVQERAVEFSELLKLAAEAVTAQPVSTDEVQQDAPLLLTEAIPSLFRGWELKSVSAAAQYNVPMPSGLDLDEPIHANLNKLLAEADYLAALPGAAAVSAEESEFDSYYNNKPAATHVSSAEPAINRLQDVSEPAASSSLLYQQRPDEDAYLDADILARRRAERQERNRDDPFYIPSTDASRLPTRDTSTPIHDILKNDNGEDLDIDSIPVMQLDLQTLGTSGGGGQTAAASLSAAQQLQKQQQQQRQQQQLHQPQKSLSSRPRIVIAADETLSGTSGRSTPRNYESETGSNDSGANRQRAKKSAKQHSLLHVDSSHIGMLSLEDNGSSVASGGPGHSSSRSRTGAGGSGSVYDLERQKRADAEMAQALKEVEKRRLEMQRANERVQMAHGVSLEGAEVVAKKPKKKKSTKTAEGDANGNDNSNGADHGAEGGAVVVKPKKKKKATTAVDGAGDGGELGPPVAIKPKKKKVKKVIDLQEAEPAS